MLLAAKRPRNILILIDICLVVELGDFVPHAGNSGLQVNICNEETSSWA